MVAVFQDRLLEIGWLNFEGILNINRIIRAFLIEEVKIVKKVMQKKKVAKD